MPEFKMNGKDAEGFQNLDAFTQGYIEAMFFTEEEQLCYPDTGYGFGDFGCGFYDLASVTLESIIADCAKFCDQFGHEISRAWYKSHTRYDAADAGRDFWFTRNGHGVGFWDRDLDDIGEKLTAACGFQTEFPALDVYIGNDGKIYFM